MTNKNKNTKTIKRCFGIVSVLVQANCNIYLHVENKNMQNCFSKSMMMTSMMMTSLISQYGMQQKAHSKSDRAINQCIITDQ